MSAVGSPDCSVNLTCPSATILPVPFGFNIRSAFVTLVVMLLSFIVTLSTVKVFAVRPPLNEVAVVVVAPRPVTVASVSVAVIVTVSLSKEVVTPLPLICNVSPLPIIVAVLSSTATLNPVVAIVST